jgi:hypothetical protein
MTYSDDVNRSRKSTTDYEKFLEYRVEALENRVEFLESQLDVMKLVLIEKDSL